MENLKLKTCLAIFKKYDMDMYNYIKERDESALNMDEVSGYARDLKEMNDKSYELSKGESKNEEV